jgi:hypothetical protein
MISLRMTSFGAKDRSYLPHRTRSRGCISRRLRYLNNLVERMQQLGFAPGDDLSDAALRAQAAVHELHVKAHYAGVSHGVGKAAEGGWPESVVKRA